MKIKSEKPYNYVAEIYSYLMNFIDYEEWANYYRQISKDEIPVNPKVLEIASGNCKLSSHLKNHYKNIIVSDFSIQMLKQCSDSELKKVCFDMLAIPFKTKFDLIFSAFDSVNYLLSLSKVKKMFKEVYKVLDDKGIFTFDISLEKNSLRNLKYLNRKGNYKGINFIQKSIYDKEKKIHYNNFGISLPNGNLIYETHKQRIYSVEEIIYSLNLCGFYVKHCYDAFSFDDASEKSERVQIIAMKERKNVNNE